MNYSLQVIMESINLRTRKGVPFPKMLQNVDIFGAPLPSFNLQGAYAVKTNAGGCVTLVIMTITLLFGLRKIQEMFMRKNPEIMQFVQENAYDVDDTFNIKDENFMMAFAIE